MYLVYGIRSVDRCIISTLFLQAKYASATPSHWREKAEARRTNKPWLRFSQQVVIAMLDRMEQLGLTRKMVENMGCCQQYGWPLPLGFAFPSDNTRQPSCPWESKPLPLSGSCPSAHQCFLHLRCGRHSILLLS